MVGFDLFKYGFVPVSGDMVKGVKSYFNQKIDDFKQKQNQKTAFNPQNIDPVSYQNWLENILTGQLDYERNLEYMYKEQAFNALEAEKNRNWQEQMSNTAFQRQAQDLQQAGFNPALITGLSGASTPVGSSAVSTSKQSMGTGEAYSKLLSQLTFNQTEITKQVISSLGQIVSALGSEMIDGKNSMNLEIFRKTGWSK